MPLVRPDFAPVDGVSSAFEDDSNRDRATHGAKGDSQSLHPESGGADGCPTPGQRRPEGAAGPGAHGAGLRPPGLCSAQVAARAVQSTTPARHGRTDRSIPFATSISVAPSPWSDQREILHIGLQGHELPQGARGQDRDGDRAELITLVRSAADTHVQVQGR